MKTVKQPTGNKKHLFALKDIFKLKNITQQKC